MTESLLTLEAVAERLGYRDVRKVKALIRSGALPTVDLATDPRTAGRASDRVDPADLAAFIRERKRKPSRRPDRRRKASHVIEFV